MRLALGSLTLRGRSFVAAGLAAVLCSLFLGERILLRIGLLLVVLPIVAVLVVVRTRYRLTSTRVLESPRVPAGHAANVSIRIDNVSRIPTGLLLVEDEVPYQLGSTPRFVLDRVEPRGVREVKYTLRSDVRGRFVVGPLSVQLADPFGMVELTRSFARQDRLVVTPAVHPLPDVGLAGDWTGGGDSHARAVAAAGEDDIAIREYRQGDDLRRVHWKSSAKRGELMVRREEQQWQSRCTILLDTRNRAHHGEGPGSSLEFAISAAASVGINLARHGFGLRLVTDGGESTSGYGGLTGVEGGPLEGMLLEDLAVVRGSHRMGLAEGIGAIRLRAGGEGLVVAVLGTIGEQDADELARLRQGRGIGVAVLVDSASWTSVKTRPADGLHFAVVARQLRLAGWRVVPVHHGESLAQVWPLAGGGYAANAPRRENAAVVEAAVAEAEVAGA